MARRRIIPTKPAALNQTNAYNQRRYQDRLWVLGEGLTRTTYVDSTAFYPTEHDYFLLVDTNAAGGAVTIYLPNAADYLDKQYVIKVVDATYGVTVSRLDSDTIDGATTYTMSAQYEWAQFISAFDGSAINWFILSQKPMGSRLQSQRFISAGSNSFTIPTDARGNKISLVYATILGGGGAGGGSVATTAVGGGGGGGGGCLVRFPYWIDTAQSSLTVYVGAGGTGVAGAAGNNGTDSYVSGTGMQVITGKGGTGGTAGTAGPTHGPGGNGGGYQMSGGVLPTTHGAGGTAGAGTDGGVACEGVVVGGGGGWGSAGSGGSVPGLFAGGWSNALQSGSGGASYFGVGAHGAAAGAAGNAPASGLGGGGSGARGDGVAGALAGGDGKSGMVLLEWIV